MTGIYVRVRRDGAWQNLEFDQLSDAELTAFAASQPVEKGWPWACTLAAWIRDHVQGTVPAEGEDTP
jgi:hypothetical protein